MIQPDGRMVLHAQPAHYALDDAQGVANPRGLHAERLGVDIHIMLADGAPVRNITAAVQNAHLEVEAVVGSPVAAGHACLTPEERDQLDAYHARVLAVVGPQVPADVRDWLTTACAPV